MLSLLWVVSESLDREAIQFELPTKEQLILWSGHGSYDVPVSSNSPQDVDDTLSEIAVRQLRLGDYHSALTTVKSIRDPKVRVRTFDRIEQKGPATAPVRFDSQESFVFHQPPKENSAPRGDANPPEDAEASPQHLLLRALDTVNGSLDPQSEIRELDKNVATALQAQRLQDALADKAIALYELADLYANNREVETAKEVLVTARAAAIASQRAISKREEQDPNDKGNSTASSAPISAIPSRALGAPPDKTAPENAATSWSGKVLGALWLLLFTCVCATVGGIAQPIFEGVGKAIVGRALAEKLQSEELAKALGVAIAKHSGKAAASPNNLPDASAPPPT